MSKHTTDGVISNTVQMWCWFVSSMICSNKPVPKYVKQSGRYISVSAVQQTFPFFSPLNVLKTHGGEAPGYWEWVINRNAASSALSITHVLLSWKLYFTCSTFSICSKVLPAHSLYSTLSVHNMGNENHSQTSPFLSTSIWSSNNRGVLHVYWCHWSLRLFKWAAFNCIHLVSLTAGFWETIRVNKPKAAPVSHAYAFVLALIS